MQATTNQLYVFPIHAIIIGHSAISDRVDSGQLPFFTSDSWGVRLMRHWRCQRRKVLAISEVCNSQSEDGTSDDILPMVCGMDEVKIKIRKKLEQFTNVGSPWYGKWQPG